MSTNTASTATGLDTCRLLEFRNGKPSEDATEFTGRVEGEIAMVKFDQVVNTDQNEVICCTMMLVSPVLPLPANFQQDDFLVFGVYDDAWTDAQQQVRDAVAMLQDRGANLRQDWFEYGLHELKWPIPQWDKPERNEAPC